MLCVVNVIYKMRAIFFSLNCAIVQIRYILEHAILVIFFSIFMNERTIVEYFKYNTGYFSVDQREYLNYVHDGNIYDNHRLEDIRGCCSR